MRVNMEGGSNPPERKMERDKQDDTSENWFKITVSAPANASNI